MLLSQLHVTSSLNLLLRRFREGNEGGRTGKTGGGISLPEGPRERVGDAEARGEVGVGGGAGGVAAGREVVSRCDWAGSGLTRSPGGGLLRWSWRSGMVAEAVFHLLSEGVDMMLSFFGDTNCCYEIFVLCSKLPVLC